MKKISGLKLTETYVFLFEDISRLPFNLIICFILIEISINTKLYSLQVKFLRQRNYSKNIYKIKTTNK